MTFRIDFPFDAFDDNKRDLFRHALASFLGVPVDDVEILEMENGSTIVTLSLPDGAAVKLLNAIKEKAPALSRIVESLKKTELRPAKLAEDSATIVSPSLWTPYDKGTDKLTLQQSASNILRVLQDDQVQLAAVPWRHFEEVVAEILRAHGMEIHTVRENPQRGPDIIARAELIPNGGFVTVAVEVKHREVVGRPLVQQALKRHWQFPALLFVTSGRFTRGVMQEANKPENRLRLFLKDGVAVRDMIRMYQLGYESQ